MDDELFKALEKENQDLKKQLQHFQDHERKAMESHRELRTRLTSILGYIKLLIRKSPNIESELLTEILSSLENESTESLHIACEIRSSNSQ